ncbi:hypothetical protein BVRB_6g154830 [Beta vulgaris subsp. vulgaris]|nr:hypothetical protein BVRB_6g154830 [Beta vulgaris subsp. vulgaris]
MCRRYPLIEANPRSVEGMTRKDIAEVGEDQGLNI